MGRFGSRFVFSRLGSGSLGRRGRQKGTNQMGNARSPAPNPTPGAALKRSLQAAAPTGRDSLTCSWLVRCQAEGAGGQAGLARCPPRGHTPPTALRTVPATASPPRAHQRGPNCTSDAARPPEGGGQGCTATLRRDTGRALCWTGETLGQMHCSPRLHRHVTQTPRHPGLQFARGQKPDGVHTSHTHDRVESVVTTTCRCSRPAVTGVGVSL